MYLKHFHLNEFPFGITPDTSFFFSSQTSQQALNTLLVATRAGEGFIKLPYARPLPTKLLKSLMKARILDYEASRPE